ncbi:hypothetical protein [Dyella sp. ASV21]|uniref:hypothetical protein n=1 Tax=Dyella sp. ASV21 TaxID=2795114 RepID=UPI0018EC631A|nr:hypothetical protein [Dyella sp. ASV21]
MSTHSNDELVEQLYYTAGTTKAVASAPASGASPASRGDGRPRHGAREAEPSSPRKRHRDLRLLLAVARLLAARHR